MPAPEGNSNAWKHGLRSSLVLVAVPPKAAWIKKLMAAFRRDLEAAVVERHGEVSLMRAAVINSASRHETIAQLAGRMLKLAGDEVKTETKLAILDRIGRATDARDRCIRALDLEATPGSAWDAYFSSPIDLPGPTDHEPATAPEATTEHQEGTE
jgi:hypothetical protein